MSRQRLISGVLCWAVLGALTVLMRPRQSFADPLLSVAFRRGVEACDYLCRECGTDKHDIVTAVENKHKSSHLENCNTGSCTSHNCSVEEEENLDALLVAIRDSRSEVLTDLLATQWDRVEYNASRQSIQVWCRAGNLVANLPLSIEQAASVAAVLP